MIQMFDFIEKSAFQRPDTPAVTFDGRTYSWAETRNRIRALAAKLYQLGVRPGDRVAFLGLNSNHCYESFFAPSLVGAAIAPLNYRLAVGELVETVDDCQPKVLIADTNFLDTARQVAAKSDHIATLIAICPDEDLAAGEISFENALTESLPEVDFDELRSRNDDTLIIYYTGGTTGKPKGVELSHINMFANSIGSALAYNLQMYETHLVSGPMFHAAAGGRAFSSTSHSGHLVIIAKFSPEELLRLVPKYRVNVVPVVPTMIPMILDHPDFEKTDWSSLRMLGYGASSIPAAILDRALKAWPGVSFVQAYGMTEASPNLTVLRAEHHALEGPFADKLGSVGLPLPHADVRVFDTDGNPLPAGEIGEVVARGPNLARGYLGDPEKTAEAFRNGWYHSGDSGYFDEDGFLFITGRIKDMIISGGENIYPIEIENVLSRHPAVKECAVIGLPDEFWGETVHAEIVLNPGKEASAEELIEYCRERIAHYKCPRSVTFHTEPLPLTPVSKIDKIALRKAHSGGKE